MKNNRPQHPEQLLHLFHNVLGQPPQPRGDRDGGAPPPGESQYLSERFTIKNKH